MRCEGQERAELIFVGGRIHTMEKDRPAARALAIADGRFLAVGEDEDVLRFRGESTVVEDLGGRAVLPGIIDSHVHVDSVGRALRDANLYDVRSIAEILERMSAQARKVGGSEAVVGRGDCFHPTSLAEDRLPTREDLDRVAADRVVAITDVNKTIVNTFALERFGIGEDAVPPAGGRIGRDPVSGRPDGAFFYAAKAMAPLGKQDAGGEDVPLKEALVAAGEALSAAGITGAVLPGAGIETIEAMRELAMNGELLIRITALPRVSLLDEEGALERAGPGCTARTDMVAVGPLKVFYDRFLMHRTALMHEPYEGEPENRGASWRTRHGLEEIVRRAGALGWALAVHTTGDRGLEEVVQAIANASVEALSCPHHVIHAYFPTRRSLEVMAEKGIAAALQPPFHRAWGETAREFVGPERAAGFLPLRTYLDAGIACGGGSDGPLASFRPGLGIHPAVTRLTAAGRVLGQGQAVTVEEALRLYTLGSAEVTGEAESRGSIRAGKLADMVVLECDPLTASPDELLELKVVRTLVGGRTVFCGG